ncbi:MAG TPA: hypothetical protein VM143_09480 [Acidimicrobiales bacterium]|nr:hypothetical protein [Acidimicrobiales bacterium]
MVPPTYIIDVELRSDPQSGQRCVFIRPVRGDDESPQALENEAKAVTLANQFPICTNSPRRANGTVDPATAAALIWRDSVELPDPTLHIEPGYAITGKPAYLEVGSPRGVNKQAAAFGHAVQLEVTSLLDVDWGDGTIDRNITRQGGPWPTGDITHTYTDTADAIAVHVTQRWRATWRVGTQTGTIADQLFTESTLSLPVKELQAVRDR